MNSLSKTRQWLDQRPYVIALAISLTLVLWMVSGVMQAQTQPEKSDKSKTIIPKVKVETFNAIKVQDTVDLYGRTEPDRITTVKAEIDSKVSKVLAKRGSWVKKGQVIVNLEANDIPDLLARSKALLEQRQLEFEGAERLNKDGYQGKVQLTSAKANLAAVKADIKRLQIALDNTIIRAPFDGVLDSRYVEQGDYLKKGDRIAMIADLSPLVVRAHATENQISLLSVGQPADIKLLNQGHTAGEIRYISSIADTGTNTFKIEIAIANDNNAILAGISSEVSVPLTQVNAIKLSPALLALDEVGNIGVKTVKNNVVQFIPIQIVKTESDGIWLKGLGTSADIITLGQGFVKAGDTVEAIMSPVEQSDVNNGKVNKNNVNRNNVNHAE